MIHFFLSELNQCLEISFIDDEPFQKKIDKYKYTTSHCHSLNCAINQVAIHGSKYLYLSCCWTRLEFTQPDRFKHILLLSCLLNLPSCQQISKGLDG